MDRKKLIPVTNPSLPPIQEYIDELQSIWDTRWLTHTGPKHQELERQLCNYLNVDNVALFSNGHLALEAALDVLGVTGEVITTPFTFASTTLAIMRNRLVPVFGDIRQDDYTLDPEKIENLITDKTSAIMPVHVYGNLCDWEAIEKIALKHNLKVIYDAAHSFGMSDNGVPVGCLGDISMFSFHATKVFHTIEGGGLTYSCGELSERYAAWRQFGMYDKENVSSIGTNAKMTEFQAAMGLCNLRHIDEEIAKREKCATRYRERLAEQPGIVICPEKPGIKYNYAYFPVRFVPEEFGQGRNDVMHKLLECNIIPRKYFYPLTSKFQVVQEYCKVQNTPIAEMISEQILALPLFADLSLQNVDYICDIILGG